MNNFRLIRCLHKGTDSTTSLVRLADSDDLCVLKEVQLHGMKEAIVRSRLQEAFCLQELSLLSCGCDRVSAGVRCAQREPCRDFLGHRFQFPSVCRLADAFVVEQYSSKEDVSVHPVDVFNELRLEKPGQVNWPSDLTACTLCMVMERCEGGDLWSVIRTQQMAAATHKKECKTCAGPMEQSNKQQPRRSRRLQGQDPDDTGCEQRQFYHFTEASVLRVLISVIAAVAGLHAKGTVHRDIKPSNVLLASYSKHNATMPLATYLSTSTEQQGFDTVSCAVKVADFGVAINASDIEKDEAPERKLRSSEHSFEGISALTGTPGYIAPEVWACHAHSFASDMWAVGCLAVELCTLTAPFQSSTLGGCVSKVTNPEVVASVISSIPEWYSNDLKRIIASLLSSRSKRRPAAAQLLRSRFIKRTLRTFADSDVLQQAVVASLSLVENAEREADESKPASATESVQVSLPVLADVAEPHEDVCSEHPVCDEPLSVQSPQQQLQPQLSATQQRRDWYDRVALDLDVLCTDLESIASPAAGSGGDIFGNSAGARDNPAPAPQHSQFAFPPKQSSRTPGAPGKSHAGGRPGSKVPQSPLQRMLSQGRREHRQRVALKKQRELERAKAQQDLKRANRAHQRRLSNLKSPLSVPGKSNGSGGGGSTKKAHRRKSSLSRPSLVSPARGIPGRPPAIRRTQSTSTNSNSKKKSKLSNDQQMRGGKGGKAPHSAKGPGVAGSINFRKFLKQARQSRNAAAENTMQVVIKSNSVPQSDCQVEECSDTGKRAGVKPRVEADVETEKPVTNVGGDTHVKDAAKVTKDAGVHMGDTKKVEMRGSKHEGSEVRENRRLKFQQFRRKMMAARGGRKRELFAPKVEHNLLKSRGAEGNEAPMTNGIPVVGDENKK